LTKREKPVGLTKDTGYQVGARRTIDVPHSTAWDFIFSLEGLNIWLGSVSSIELREKESYQLDEGVSGEVRVLKPGSHIRLTWQPSGYPRPSMMQVRVIPKGAKTTIAFHQEHLPSSAARKTRQRHFKHCLDLIEEQLGSA
jgi:uncharacterized protein YndB with AHSA1/START domain